MPMPKSAKSARHDFGMSKCAKITLFYKLACQLARILCQNALWHAKNYQIGMPVCKKVGFWHILTCQNRAWHFWHFLALACQNYPIHNSTLIYKHRKLFKLLLITNNISSAITSPKR